MLTSEALLALNIEETVSGFRGGAVGVRQTTQPVRISFSLFFVTGWSSDFLGVCSFIECMLGLLLFRCGGAKSFFF